MNLNYTKSGTGDPVVILHGLFGMLDNWKSIGNILDQHYTVYLIDQRNHGKSPHTPLHSYALMADDLQEFFTQQNIEKAHIIGHSMGGKTAMQFAINHPDLVEKLIVVDMGIQRYSAGHDAIFDALQGIDTEKIHNRKDAELILSKLGIDLPVRQFLLKNLHRVREGKYRWKFNLEALSKNYETEILASIAEGNIYTGKTLFIRGEKSNYIDDEDWIRIQQVFPIAVLQTVKNAGHWVHSQKQEETVQLIQSFLEA